MSSHIVYLSNNQSVCMKPQLLGSDFVIVDYSGGGACKTCLALVTAHNEREDQYELSLTLPPANAVIKYEPELSVSSFLMGLAFGLLFFLAVALTYKVVFNG